MMSAVRSEGHLDAGEGDGRGGVGPDHQGDEGGPQVSKHVGQLMWGRSRGEKKKSGSETLDKHTTTTTQRAFFTFDLFDPG